MAVNPKDMLNRGGGNVGSKIQGGVSNTFGAIGGFINGLASINRFKFAAIMVWFVGVYSTSVVMNAGGVGFNPSTFVDSVTIGWYANQFLGAFLVQALFTIIEAPIFQRKNVNALSVFVVVLDTLINSIVVWPIARGFVGSEAWNFFTFAIETVTGVFNSGNGLDIGSGDVIIVLLTLFGGVSIAAAPEMLWGWGSNRRGT